MDNFLKIIIFVTEHYTVWLLDSIMALDSYLFVLPLAPAFLIPVGLLKILSCLHGATSVLVRMGACLVFPGGLISMLVFERR